MQVIYRCNGKTVNLVGHRSNYSDPFRGVIPNTGDFVLLGEHTPEFKHLEYKPMTKYKVISRTFSAIEDYNASYSGQTCTIELEEVVE